MLPFPLFAAFPKGRFNEFIVNLAGNRGVDRIPERHGLGEFVKRITGMKPQSKLWKQIPQQAAVYHTLRFSGLFPIPNYWDWIVRPSNFSVLRF